jgi:hypothetical protein
MLVAQKRVLAHLYITHIISHLLRGSRPAMQEVRKRASRQQQQAASSKQQAASSKQQQQQQ